MVFFWHFDIFGGSRAVLSNKIDIDVRHARLMFF